MRNVSLVMLVIVLVAYGSSHAGNSLRRTILEDPGIRKGAADVSAEMYYHGTNKVFEIVVAGRKTTVISTSGDYNSTFCDNDGDGVFETIIIAFHGKVLEVFKKVANERYIVTPQSEIDEINKVAREAEKMTVK